MKFTEPEFSAPNYGYEYWVDVINCPQCKGTGKICSA